MSSSTDLDISSFSIASNVSQASAAIVNRDVKLNRYLHGVELCNFKSYSGKHLIGPLTQLTAIIGPNGSGKSNLMDAISFALVVKSNSLRAKKLSDLMPLSADDDRPTYVKLCFQTRAGTDPISFKRSFERHSSTTYYVDDELVSKSDYVAQLKVLGFNVKVPWFLVFRDTISNFITKNPKDFTDILEEISGSIRFKAPYDEAKAKCDEKGEELHQLLSQKKTIMESKRFIDFLFKQSNRNDHLFQEIVESKIKLALLELYGIQAELNRLEDVDEQLVSNIKNKAEAIAQQRQQRESLQNEISQLEKAVADTSKQLRDLEINIMCKGKLDHQSSLAAVALHEKELKQVESNIGKLTEQLDKSESFLVELKRQVKLTELEINRLEKEMIEAAQGLQLNDQDLQEYDNLKAQWEASPEAIELEDKVSKLKQSVEALESEIKIEQINQSLLANKLRELEEQNKAQVIDNLKLELQKHSKEKSILEKSFDEVILRIEQLDAETIQARVVMNQVKSELKLKNSNFRVKDKLEREKTLVEHLQRTYSGVYGRVRDLCQPIDKKYSIAVNRIMDEYASALVVDSGQTVNLILKNERSKLSNQMFIALDTIKVSAIKPSLRNLRIGSGTCCLIHDLIRCKDASLQKVVAFVAGNTVYCETQGQAMTVAYHLETRNTAITQNGILYSASGQISFNNSTMERVNSSSSEIHQMEEDLKQKSSAFLEKCKDLEMKKSESSQLESKIASLETRIKLVQRSLKNFQESLVEDEKQAAELKTSIEQGEAQLKVKQSELEQIRAQREQAEADLSDIEQRFYADFLDRLAFPSLKQFKMMFFSNVEDVVLQLNEAKMRLMELKNKQKMEADKKLEDKIGKWKDLYEDVKHKLDVARDELKASEKKLEDDENELSNLKNNLTDNSQLLTAFQIEAKSFEDQYQALIDEHTLLVQSTVDIKHSLQQLYESRHRRFKQCYFEGIALPFLQDPEMFNNIFLHQEGKTTEEIHELESQILPNFELYKIPEMAKNSEDLVQMQAKLDTDIRGMEEQIQKLTLSDNSLEDQRDNIVREYGQIQTKINNARSKLMALKVKFMEVKNQRSNCFQVLLEKVSTKLQLFYQAIMNSPAAQSFLIAENPEEPYEGGIIFNCIVPGKIFQPLSCLSGGEKCLAVFAFIFSVHSEALPPFFMLDEIDGPLDQRNIAKLIRFLKSKCEETQFIYISHRAESFCQALSLIGVYKKVVAGDADAVDGVQSQTLSLEVEDSLQRMQVQN